MKNYRAHFCVNTVMSGLIFLLMAIFIKADTIFVYANEEIENGWYQEYGYTGSEQCFEVPVSGEYLLEVWGAQGGETRGGIGGKGGYSYGKVMLNAGEKIYIQVGGNGLDHYGYNGGGMGETEKENICNYGGGATHMASQSGLLCELYNVQNEIFIVSGGGGGSERPEVKGGAGGGGNADGENGGEWEGYDRNIYFNYTEFVAEGGKQTEGGRYGNNYDNWNKSKGMSGTFGKGGDAYDHEYAINNGYMEEGFRDYGGGGGGGWYGGGGIEWAGGGGGGSGHISDKLYDAGGNSGARSGDGYARITFLKPSEYDITIKYLKYNPNNHTWEQYEECINENIKYGSSFDIPSGSCPTGYHLDHKDADNIKVTENSEINVYYYPDKVSLDVNGNMDGSYSGDVSGFGLFDVYISGVLISGDVSDYYNTELLYGQYYEIKNIRALDGKKYLGVNKGRLNGIISQNKSVELSYETLSFRQTVNHYKWNAQNKNWECWMSQQFMEKYGAYFTPQYADTPKGYYNYSRTYENGRKVDGEYTYEVYYYPNTYTIYFDANGGSCELSEKQVIYGSNYGNLPDAEREGCDFCGWYTTAYLFLNSEEAGMVEKISEYSIMTETNDLTVYAGWIDTTEPFITLKAADEISKDYNNVWKNNPVNILLEISDCGFAGIDKVIISNTGDNSKLFERNYAGNVMNDSFNIVIGNREKYLYEGVYQWKVTAVDKAGNTGECVFNTKLDYTPPVIMDIAGEYDSDGKLISDTVYQYYDDDNLIWQKAFDEKKGINAVAGMDIFCLYPASNPGHFISDELTPFINKSPYEIKYDFTKRTKDEYAVLLCATDHAGNKSYRIIITKDGFNRMFRRTLPRENYA